MPKKSLFEIQATAKTSQVTMSSHYPVARDKENHIVASTCLTHCSGRPRPANLTGDLSVGGNFAQGNLPQCCPNH